MVLGVAPSPIPAPLPPWAKVLLQVAPYIAAGVPFALEHIGPLHASDESAPSQWRRAQLVFENILDPDPKTNAITSIDIVNITQGTVDSTWTDADYTTVQNAVGSLGSDWTTRMQQSWRFKEVRYYVMSFNPLTLDKPFAKSGAPERIYPTGIAGTAIGTQAPQVAMTSTEITAYPRHWGRNYWPYIGASLVDSTGHIPNSMVDSWCLSVHDRYQALMTAEFFPVVPVTRIENANARALLTLDRVQVDNVPDVIRRRRPITTYRKNNPLAAQLLPAA
jgi:hypothetical protein